VASNVVQQFWYWFCGWFWCLVVHTMRHHLMQHFMALELLVMAESMAMD